MTAFKKKKTHITSGQAGVAVRGVAIRVVDSAWCLENNQPSECFTLLNAALKETSSP